MIARIDVKSSMFAICWKDGSLRVGLGGRGVAALLCVLLTSLAVVAPASAQSGEAESKYSERVRKLNDEAVRAIINEDYARAISLLEESRSLQESNIVYLNLGRAYQKMGKCEPAREALRQVDTAPKVNDPPSDIINKKAEQFLGELDEQCPTEDEPQMAAADEQKADPESTDPESTKPQMADAEPSSWRSTLGWASLGTGLVLIGGGAYFHFDAESRRDGIGGLEDEPASVSYAEAQNIEQTANTLDTIGLSMAIAGGVAGVMGTYFLVTDAPSESDASQVSVQPHRGGASVTFSTSW